MGVREDLGLPSVASGLEMSSLIVNGLIEEVRAALPVLLDDKGELNEAAYLSLDRAARYSLARFSNKADLLERLIADLSGRNNKFLARDMVAVTHSSKSADEINLSEIMGKKYTALEKYQKMAHSCPDGKEFHELEVELEQVKLDLESKSTELKDVLEGLEGFDELMRQVNNQIKRELGEYELPISVEQYIDENLETLKIILQLDQYTTTEAVMEPLRQKLGVDERENPVQFLRSMILEVLIDRQYDLPHPKGHDRDHRSAVKNWFKLDLNDHLNGFMAKSEVTDEFIISKAMDLFGEIVGLKRFTIPDLTKQAGAVYHRDEAMGEIKGCFGLNTLTTETCEALVGLMETAENDRLRLALNLLANPNLSLIDFQYIFMVFLNKQLILGRHEELLDHIDDQDRLTFILNTVYNYRVVAKLLDIGADLKPDAIRVLLSQRVMEEFIQLNIFLEKIAKVHSDPLVLKLLYSLSSRYRRVQMAVLANTALTNEYRDRVFVAELQLHSGGFGQTQITVGDRIFTISSSPIEKQDAEAE